MIVAVTNQLLELAVALLAAPLFLGWLNKCRAWLQNRSAPSVWLPYRSFRKLFHKDAVLAEDASPLFRATPYIVFGSMVVAAAVIPSLGSALPFSRVADAIALVGLFATARVFMSLAAMDIGTPFGTLGARREMMVGFLAEPALLMVIFTVSLIASSTSLAAIAGTLVSHELAIYPSLAFAAIAFLLVLLAENARIPVDNPATHLELTMIHEAMILEYSGRYLALIEWASGMKLFIFLSLLANLYVPWGIATTNDPLAILIGSLTLLGKVAVLGCAIAALETRLAKLRLFRVPELLSVSFVLALLAVTSSFVVR